MKFLKADLFKVWLILSQFYCVVILNDSHDAY